MAKKIDPEAVARMKAKLGITKDDKTKTKKQPDRHPAARTQLTAGTFPPTQIIFVHQKCHSSSTVRNIQGNCRDESMARVAPEVLPETEVEVVVAPPKPKTHSELVADKVSRGEIPGSSGLELRP